MNTKNKFLKIKTKPIEIKKQKTSALVENMALTGFQGRKLGEVTKIWQQMLKERKITIWLGISGAIVPAGMRKIISFLIKNRFVDAIVSTGAQMFHETFETLGKRHYVGDSVTNDYRLFKEGIVRIYDVFAEEMDLLAGEFFIKRIAGKYLEDNQIYSSREITWLMGRELAKVSKDRDSILINAYKQGVPIFIPSFGDSYIGIAVWYSAMHYGKTFIVDTIKDLSESAFLTLNSKKTGVIYLGGGVPKNYIQQTAEITPNLADPAYLKSEKPIPEREGFRKPHSYAIQITADTPHFGGLSGCTFEEAQSWGKVSRGAKKIQCFADITLALPFVAQTLFEKSMGDAKKRKKPMFDWSKTPVKVNYR
jgi:deoxyhypusine synthase